MVPSGKGMSPSRKRTALRQLMRKVPEGDALFQVLIGLGGPSGQSAAHDRAAAIIGATYIEHALRQAIAQQFKPDADDPKFNYLFDSDDAPYREFAGRTRLAKALGIIDAEEYRRLEIIRQVRNAFAHTMAPITFEDVEIAALCADLVNLEVSTTVTLLGVRSVTGNTLVTEIFSGNRRRFVFAVFEFFEKFIPCYPGESGPPSILVIS